MDHNLPPHPFHLHEELQRGHLRQPYIQDSIPCSMQKLNDVFNGLPFNIFMCVITFYVLFADDFRMVFFPPSADMGFTIVVLICMLIYVLELVLTIIAKVTL